MLFPRIKMMTTARKRTIQACAHLQRRIANGQRGSSLVEVALLMPTLLIMLVAASEMGRIAYYAIEVSSAARAGALYAAQNHGTAANTAGIQLAASYDAHDVSGLNATVATSCSCSNGAAITCSDASSQCSTPARIEEFVQVNTSVAISPIFQYPGLPASYSLSGQATIRVEQ
jgi:Flp pilus assembly protein TadG